MKYIIYILLFTLALSCKEKTGCCTIVQNTIEIEFRDTIGRNLLDQSKSYAYMFDSMKHYYLNNNGVKEEVYISSTADFPKHMYIYEPLDSLFLLRLFPYALFGNDGVHTYYDYLQLNSSDEDTIKCDILTNSTNIIIKKIWYNDSLVYTESVQPSKYFIVRK